MTMPPGGREVGTEIVSLPDAATLRSPEGSSRRSSSHARSLAANSMYTVHRREGRRLALAGVRGHPTRVCGRRHPIVVRCSASVPNRQH